MKKKANEPLRTKAPAVTTANSVKIEDLTDEGKTTKKSTKKTEGALNDGRTS